MPPPRPERGFNVCINQHARLPALQEPGFRPLRCLGSLSCRWGPKRLLSPISTRVVYCYETSINNISTKNCSGPMASSEFSCLLSTTRRGQWGSGLEIHGMTRRSRRQAVWWWWAPTHASHPPTYESARAMIGPQLYGASPPVTPHICNSALWGDCQGQPTNPEMRRSHAHNHHFDN